METKRIYLIDTIRGITIISMVLFHFMWDLVYLFGVEAPWMHNNIGYIWQQSICWSFILLSGFCWSFGKKPFQRGVLVFSLGLVITVVTVFFLWDERIIYGILTFLGTAMILMCFFDPLFKKAPPLAGSLASFLLFLLFKKISRGYLGFGSCRLVLPQSFYANYVSTFFGMPFNGFYSTDYFALFPWIFLFITGYFLKKVFDQYDLFRWIPQVKEPVFSFLGKHSLFIYIIHQPLLYGICIIWSKIH